MSNNRDQIIAMTKWKLLGEMSCAGCKFMYFRDTGYSNYTVEGTEADCALGRNRNLPADIPHDWNRPGKKDDNWVNTKDSRCERYEHSFTHAHMNVENDDFEEELMRVDLEVAAAIRER